MKSKIRITSFNVSLLFTIFVLVAATVASSNILSAGVASAQRTQGLAGTTFPPPVFYTIRGQPSYEISILFGRWRKTCV